MSTNDRITRPPIDRTRPVRNWAALLGRFSPGTAPGDGSSAPATGIDSLGGAVSRSVELGYRVVDEYMRQGQRAALRLQQGRAGAEHWGQDVQDITLRMAQYASELIGTWVELLERAGSARAAAAPPALAPQPSPEEPQPAPRPGMPVRVAVDSRQPCEVTVELRAEGAGQRLVAHALRAPEPWKPRLDGVEIGDPVAAGATIMRITVPPTQPPGTYEALLVDEQTSRPVGVVRVTIGEGRTQTP